MCKYDNNLFIVFSVQPKAQDKYDSVLMLVPLKNTADTNTLLNTELTWMELFVFSDPHDVHTEFPSVWAECFQSKREFVYIITLLH